MIEKFLKSSLKVRNEIINKYAQETEVGFDIVEKDIWVCYALDQIFKNENWGIRHIYVRFCAFNYSYNS